MREPLNIWLLTPYHTGSHRAWAEGFAAHSRHRVRLLTMPGYFWKWRMHGAALELAAQAQELLAAGERPDLLFATSMVNLPAFLALTRRELAAAPAALYMHENQLTYPLQPGEKRDLTYGMIQHLSMLAADRVFFNSVYHMQSWFAELPRLLKHFPDYAHLETVAAVKAKASVLPVGCDLRRLAIHADATLHCAAFGAAPLILWNQRWEYDKDPVTMLRALYALAEEGLAFRVALAGQNFRVQPTEFEEARVRLGERLIHYGYVDSPADYARLLWKSDIVISTALHEFFGVSIVEAVYCGCLPILPRRLSYPELIPPAWHELCLYDDFAGLLDRLRAAIAAPQRPAGLAAAAGRCDWSALIETYDDLLAGVLGYGVWSGASPTSRTANCSA